MQNHSGSVIVCISQSPFGRQNPQSDLNKESYNKELLAIKGIIVTRSWLIIANSEECRIS